MEGLHSRVRGAERKPEWGTKRRAWAGVEFRGHYPFVTFEFGYPCKKQYQVTLQKSEIQTKSMLLSQKHPSTYLMVSYFF